MLSTVNLYDYFSIKTYKIYYIIINCLLSSEFKSIYLL